MNITEIISPDGNLRIGETYRFTVVSEDNNVMYRLKTVEGVSDFSLSKTIAYTPSIEMARNTIQLEAKKGRSRAIIFDRNYKVDSDPIVIAKRKKAIEDAKPKPKVIIALDMSVDYIDTSLDLLDYVARYEDFLDVKALGICQTNFKKNFTAQRIDSSLFYFGTTYIKDPQSFDPYLGGSTPLSNKIVTEARLAARTGDYVWITNTGIMGDIAQALFDAPDIKNSIKLFTMYPHEDRLYDSSAYFWIYSFLKNNPELYWIDSGSLSQYMEATPNTFLATEGSWGRTVLNHLISSRIDEKYKYDNIDKPFITSLAGRYRLADHTLPNYFIDLAKKSDASRATVPMFPEGK